MNYKLLPAGTEHISVVRNLMQFYIYDFSEFVACKIEQNGLFTEYPGLDDYWKKDNNKFAYVIQKDENYAGFVLVKFIESAEHNYYSIAEFFIMKMYRRQGLGKAIATDVFNLYKGTWEVYQRETNKPAYIFWHNVIDAYTKGHFTERLQDGRTLQKFTN